MNRDELREYMLENSIFYCNCCGAILNEQYDFDPLSKDTFFCEECGSILEGDELRYVGSEFHPKHLCERCGALLDVQTGFIEGERYECEACGYESEPESEDVETVLKFIADHIDDDDDEYDDFRLDNDDEDYSNLRLDNDDDDYTGLRLDDDLRLPSLNYQKQREYGGARKSAYASKTFQRYKSAKGGSQYRRNRSAKAKEQKLKEKFKDQGILILIMAVAMMVVIYNMATSIGVPMSSKNAKGSNYEDVQREFEDAGFKDVNVKAVEPGLFDGSVKDGEVDYVEIDGDKKFSKGEEFSKDAEVIIYYFEK